MYYVYVLYSPNFHRTYIGQTGNEADRLHRHNAGYVKSTKPFRPWMLIRSEEFSTRAEAMKREKWLKSSSGRKWLNTILDRPLRQGNGLSVSSSIDETRSRPSSHCDDEAD